MARSHAKTPLPYEDKLEIYDVAREYLMEHLKNIRPKDCSSSSIQALDDSLDIHALVQVLRNFFDLYFKKREAQHNSNSNFIWQSVQAITSTVTNAAGFGYSEPSQTTISRIKEDVSTQLDVLNKHENVFDIILILRKHAERAQLKDSGTNSIPALLQSTLNGMASLAIWYLSKQCNYEPFIQLQESLSQTAVKLRETITLEISSMRNTERLNADYKKTVFLLAMFGQSNWVNEACLLSLLNSFYKPPTAEIIQYFMCDQNSVHNGVPLEFQMHFFFWLYRSMFQKMDQKDFETFYRSAVDQSRIKENGVSPVALIPKLTSFDFYYSTAALTSIDQLPQGVIKGFVIYQDTLYTYNRLKQPPIGILNLAPEKVQQIKEHFIPKRTNSILSFQDSQAAPMRHLRRLSDTELLMFTPSNMESSSPESEGGKGILAIKSPTQQ